MLHAQKFHASVAQNAISKVTRLFNSSLDDIFAELIQNARRAGATSVSIDRIDHPGFGPSISVKDNGPGIADPKSLFTLGDSNWNAETIAAEDAAGMGFFSLAGRRIDVMVQQLGTDQSWKLSADPAAFKGETPVQCTPGPQNHYGLTVIFQARENESFVAAANDAALYCPIEVIVDGQVAKREDFLEKAIHIEVWNGIRIGLFDYAPVLFHRNGNVNFYGVTLQAGLPSQPQEFHQTYYAKIDVIDCAQFKLVLPARKEVVADAFFETLQKHIIKMHFEYIAKQETHSLAFPSWLQARKIGIEIPQASRQLRPFSPAIADNTFYDRCSPENVDIHCILIDSDGNPSDEQNLAHALKYQDEEVKLYEPCISFNGYGWYNVLSCLAITAYQLSASDTVERIPLGQSSLNDERPEQLFIEGELGSQTDVKPWRLETDVILIGTDEDSIDDVELHISRQSTLTHTDLIGLLTNSLFTPSDDAEDGSFDEQERRFADRAEDLVIRLLQSNHDVNLNAIIRVIERELYWIPRKDTIVTITIDNGRIDVTGLEPKTTPDQGTVQ